jgi:hypothetical protein
MSSSELLHLLMCPPCVPVEEATEEIADVGERWSLHV